MAQHHRTLMPQTEGATMRDNQRGRLQMPGAGLEPASPFEEGILSRSHERERTPNKRHNRPLSSVESRQKPATPQHLAQQCETARHGSTSMHRRSGAMYTGARPAPRWLGYLRVAAWCSLPGVFAAITGELPTAKAAETVVLVIALVAALSAVVWIEDRHGAGARLWPTCSCQAARCRGRRSARAAALPTSRRAPMQRCGAANGGADETAPR